MSNSKNKKPITIKDEEESDEVENISGDNAQKGISHINDSRESKFIKISNVKRFFKEEQTLRLDSGESVELKSDIRLMGTSLDMIIQSLNDYVGTQLKLLKYSIPKKVKGDNKGEFKFNTILDRIVTDSGFPKIPIPQSSEKVEDKDKDKDKVSGKVYGFQI